MKRKFLTLLLAFVASWGISLSHAQSSGWDEVVFTTTSSSAVSVPSGTVFNSPGGSFTLTTTDTDGKMTIESNNAVFGSTIYDSLRYTVRLKAGAKTLSNKNLLTLNFNSDGYLRIASRSASGTATDRNLVVTQGSSELYNQVVKDADATSLNGTNAYPFIYIPVQSGEATITYPTGSLNFYSFAFREELPPTEPQQLTVAEALNIGADLAHNTHSEDVYTISGYVSATAGDYDTGYKNQNFWISDDPTSTASSVADGAFYVYRGKPSTGKGVIVGSYVQFTCRIKKYNALIENSEQNIEVTVLSEPEPITVRLDPRSCPNWETVGLWAWTESGGIITNLFTSWPGVEVSKDENGWYSYTFDASIQNVNIIWNDFNSYGYQTVDIEDIAISTCYAISSSYDSYGHYYAETLSCSTDVLPAIEATVAEALAAGAELADNGVTERHYAITGYISALDGTYSTTYQDQNFWIADDPFSTAASNADGAFYVYHGVPSTGKALAVGTRVRLEAAIKKYVKNGTALIENYEQNIVITVLSEPAVDPKDDGWDEIVFTAATDKTAMPEDTMFLSPLRNFMLYANNGNSSMAFDADNVGYGTNVNDSNMYHYRLKTGGKTKTTSAGVMTNYIELEVAKAGYLRIAPHSPNQSATDRTLVVTQNGVELLNKIIKDEDAAQGNVFPYDTVQVAAGTVLITYPVNALNFYSFAFAEEIPEAPEEEVLYLTLAQAIARGQTLADRAVDPAITVVSGYVLNAEAFSVQYMNQSWYMAEDAGAESSTFMAYHCFPIDNGDTLKVLNGDQVQLTGHLKRYNDIIEIEQGNATFLYMVPGDHSVNKTVEEITVAQALEIGAALGDNESTVEQYIITGYVSAKEEYNSAYQYQNFWVSDDATSTAASNANGAFYVYRGKADTESDLKIGSLVRFKTTIKKYGIGSEAIIETTSPNAAVTLLDEPEYPTDHPSPQYLANEGFDLNNNFVMCFQLPNECSNPIAFPGSYNDWEPDETMLWMQPLSGFNGWYTVSVSYDGDVLEGKPVSVPDGNVGSNFWNYQCGDQDAWEYVDGKYADISGGYADEANIYYYSKGAYIYKINYWKKQVDPCATVEEIEYAVLLYLPSNACEGFVPVIRGDFNNWEQSDAVLMTATTDGAGNTCYIATFTALPGSSYKFCDLYQGWESQLQYYDSDYDMWRAFGDFTLEEDYTNITYDFRNTDMYRVYNCPETKEAYTVDDFEAGIHTWTAIETYATRTSNEFKSGINLSDYVLYAERTPSQDNWAGAILSPYVESGYKYVHAYMYRNNYGTPNLKVSDSDPQDIAPMNEIIPYEWQDVVFDISDYKATGIEFLFFMVDRNDLTETAWVLIDEVQLSNDPTPRTKVVPDDPQPQPTYPTAVYLEEQGYDLDNNYVLCFQMPNECANPIAFVGSYNDWSEDLQDMLYFTPLTDYEGWYCVQIPYNDDYLEGKPVSIKDGVFAWKYQVGDPNAWEYVDGNSADIVNGYDNEANIYYYNPGVYIYKINYWKKHIDPCEEEVENNYTIKVYLPDNACEEFTPAVVGSFCNWTADNAIQLIADVDGEGKTYYTATIEAVVGDEFKIFDLYQGWDYEILYKYGSDWIGVSNCEFGEETTVTIDYSGTQYRVKSCPVPVLHEATVTVLVPSDCGVDVSEGFYIYWQNTSGTHSALAPMTPLGGNKFTYTFDPDDESYSYHFQNRMNNDGSDVYKYTTEMTGLEDESLCWEVRTAFSNSNYRSLMKVADCEMEDHDYRPTNLQAEPIGHDTVLFSWNLSSSVQVTEYAIFVYDEEGHEINARWFYPDEVVNNTYLLRLHNTEPMTVDHWELRIETYHVQSGSYYYEYYRTYAEGCTVEGDARIPHNITVTETGEGIYHVAWESAPGAAEFSLYYYDNSGYHSFRTSNWYYDLTLEDNYNYDICMDAFSQNGSNIGWSECFEFNTYRQEARDINLYFYIPEHVDFLGNNGASIVWTLQGLTGEHIVPLVVDEAANGHWYKATVANFDRESFNFSLINATTAEAATKTLEWSGISSDQYFIVQRDLKGDLWLTADYDYVSYLYPHDYAVTNMQAVQSEEDGSITFSWEANEQTPYYYLYVYDGEADYDYWSYRVSGNSYTITDVAFPETTTLPWAVMPRDDNITYFPLRAYSEYTVEPSPTIATNLRVEENEDGTYTFSWTPAQSSRVDHYSYYVTDLNWNTITYWEDEDITEPTYTTALNVLWGGSYYFVIDSYDEDGNWLQGSYLTFDIAPAAPHDIHLRVLITDNSGIDLSTGNPEFNIQTASNNYMTVYPTQEQYGWWSYTLSNTTAYGVKLRVMNSGGFTSNQRTVYGDACLALVGENLVDEDCDARAGDYTPYNLFAMPNGDGTYTISWAMNATERVSKYYIYIEHPDSLWSDDMNSQTTQCITSFLPYAGKYGFTVTVRDDNGNTIGQATDTLVIAPQEHSIQIRVLEQPSEAGWSGYRVWSDWSYIQLNFTAELDAQQKLTGWYHTTVTTTDPAIRFVLLTAYGNQYTYWLSDDICLQIENDVEEVDCDAARHNYTLSNVHAEPQSDGKVNISWDCTEDPEGFYLQTLCNDSTTYIAWWTFDGERRNASILLNIDSITTINWYMVPYMVHNDQMMRAGDFVWGNDFTAVPSIYVPQNLQATPNGDGTYTFTWDAVQADTVKYYEVRIQHPNGDSDWEVVQTNNFVTPMLTDLGTYWFYVYVLDSKYNTLGWSSMTVNVTELEQPRDITVRVLVHPDSERTEPGQLEVYRSSEDLWESFEPNAQGNYWFSYTFSSKMPVQRIRLMDSEQNVAADACFEYEYDGGLKRAECDAQAHDYRITDGSLNTVSEPGKVTMSWSAEQKAESYYLDLYRLNYQTYNYNHIGTYYATDTCYTYLVPDAYDGQGLEWIVGAYAPVRTQSVYGGEVTMHKNAIVLSQFEATSTDSVNFHFTWQANTDTVQYEIMICRYDYQSEAIHQALAAQASYDYAFLSNEASYYTWYVRAVNAAATPLTAWATAGRLYVKRNLQAITDLQGSTSGNMITFSWTTTAPATAAYLYYQEDPDAGYETIINDTILYTNSLSIQAIGDGTYEIDIRPMAEVTQGELKALNEWHYATTTYFSVPTYNVSISVQEGGRMYNDPSGNYPNGYKLWIYAYPEDHYRFIGWSDGVSQQDRQITISSDTTLIALFERIPMYTLTINAGQGGMLRYYDGDQEQYVTVAQYQKLLEQGQGAQMQAIPNDGYIFYQWSDGNTEQDRFLSGYSDTTFTADFRQIYYATVQAGEGGRVNVTGAMSYDNTTKKYTCYDGLEITLRANADEGYRFTGWSDGDHNVVRTITVHSDITLTASFEEVTTPLNQYTVRILTNDASLGEVSQVSGTYYEGDQITITATPKEHAMFTGWSDGDLNATRQITITQDTTLTASFTIKRITLAISAGAGGSVNDTIVNGTYDYGSIVTITATADEGYHFVQWSDGW